MKLISVDMQRGVIDTQLTAHDKEVYDIKLSALEIELKSMLGVMQRGVVDTQLIAHDKEVYDIAWGGVGVFASVSADGSVRVFDLR